MWPDDNDYWIEFAFYQQNKQWEAWLRQFERANLLIFVSIAKPLRFTGQTQGVGSSFN